MLLNRRQRLHPLGRVVAELMLVVMNTLRHRSKNKGKAEEEEEEEEEQGVERQKRWLSRHKDRVRRRTPVGKSMPMLKRNLQRLPMILELLL